MAQFLILLSVLFLLAAVNIDNLATLLPSADDTLTNVSAVHFSTEESNNDRRSLEIDSETTHLERLITKKVSGIERFARYAEIAKRKVLWANNEYLCESKSEAYPYAWNIAPTAKSDYDSSWTLYRCLYPGKKCGEHINVGLPKHITGTCQTRYVYQSLIESNSSWSQNSTKYAVGCVCTVTSNTKSG